MTSAERLLAAAELLEKRAGEATDGPWTRTNTEATGAVWIDTPETRHAFSLHGWTADATYIATMHPEVGKALANTLRDSVRYLAGGVDGIPTQHTLCADFIDYGLPSTHCPHYDGLLTLADLLLAGAS